MKIAHISDIHASNNGMFNREAAEKGIKRINEENPDMVIITGDLTCWGIKEEYEFAMEFLEQIEPEKLIVPGNHDERTDGYHKFEKYIGKRYFTKEMDGIFFMGLDSADPDMDTGHMGRELISWAREQLRRAEDMRKVVFFHHHLLPIPHTGRERNILTDAPDVIEMLIENRVSLVLGGHKHVPWVWNLNDMIISHTASFSSRRAPVENSYNVVEIDEEKMSIERVYNLSGKRISVYRWV
jgi:Icc protein